MTNGRPCRDTKCTDSPQQPLSLPRSAGRGGGFLSKNHLLLPCYLKREKKRIKKENFSLTRGGCFGSLPLARWAVVQLAGRRILAPLIKVRVLAAQPTKLHSASPSSSRPRTTAFHAVDRGSNPLGDAKKRAKGYIERCNPFFRWETVFQHTFPCLCPHFGPASGRLAPDADSGLFAAGRGERDDLAACRRQRGKKHSRPRSGAAPCLKSRRQRGYRSRLSRSEPACACAGNIRHSADTVSLPSSDPKRECVCTGQADVQPRLAPGRDNG